MLHPSARHLFKTCVCTCFVFKQSFSKAAACETLQILITALFGWDGMALLYYIPLQTRRISGFTWIYILVGNGKNFIKSLRWAGVPCQWPWKALEPCIFERRHFNLFAREKSVVVPNWVGSSFSSICELRKNVLGKHLVYDTSSSVYADIFAVFTLWGKDYCSFVPTNGLKRN